jgi:hypothetical protein
MEKEDIESFIKGQGNTQRLRDKGTLGRGAEGETETKRDMDSFRLINRVPETR